MSLIFKRESGSIKSSTDFIRQTTSRPSLYERFALDSVLTKHTGSVNEAAFNRTGELLVSGSDDGYVNLWNVNERELRLSWQTTHTANIFSVIFIPETNDGVVVSGAGDGMVQMHDITHETTRVLTQHYDRVKVVQVYPDMPQVVLSGSEDQTIRELDMRMSSYRKMLKLRNPIHTFDICQTKPWLLAVGGTNDILKVFDRRNLCTEMENPKSVWSMSLRDLDPKGETEGITGVKFSSDGSQVLANFFGNCIYLLSLIDETNEKMELPTQKRKRKNFPSTSSTSEDDRWDEEVLMDFVIAAVQQLSRDNYDNTKNIANKLLALYGNFWKMHYVLVKCHIFEAFRRVLGRDSRSIISSHLQKWFCKETAEEILEHPACQTRLSFGGEEYAIAEKLYQFWNEKNDAKLRQDHLVSALKLNNLPFDAKNERLISYIEGQIDCDVEDLVGEVEIEHHLLSQNHKICLCCIAACKKVFIDCRHWLLMSHEESVQHAIEEATEHEILWDHDDAASAFGYDTDSFASYFTDELADWLLFVKMTQRRIRDSDREVQNTNEDAQISKLSCHQLGYINDPFVQYFVRFPCRRSPLINRGYFARCYALNALLEEFLDAVESSGGGNKMSQVISLGAGFDSTWFNLKQNGRQPTKFIELDFAEVTEEKVRRIFGTPQLKELLSEDATHDSLGELVSNEYTILPVDLRKLEDFDTVLKRAKIDPKLPTYVLSECVLVYLEPFHGASIVKHLGEQFTNSVFVIYEQVCLPRVRQITHHNVI
eukprot:g7765.t1